MPQIMSSSPKPCFWYLYSPNCLSYKFLIILQISLLLFVVISHCLILEVSVIKDYIFRISFFPFAVLLYVSCIYQGRDTHLVQTHIAILILDVIVLRRLSLRKFMVEIARSVSRTIGFFSNLFLFWFWGFFLVNVFFALIRIPFHYLWVSNAHNVSFP